MVSAAKLRLCSKSEWLDSVLLGSTLWTSSKGRMFDSSSIQMVPLEV